MRFMQRARQCATNARGVRVLNESLRIFSRFEKLDVIFLGLIHFALIVKALRFLFSVNTP